MSDKRKNKPTLRLTFGVVLCSMVFLMAAAIISVSYYSARSNTLTVSEQLMQHVAHLAYERVNGLLAPIGVALDLTHEQLAQGPLHEGDIAALEPYLVEFLSTYEAVSMVNFGDVNGQFVMAKRMADGSISTKLITIEAGVRTVVWRYRQPSGGLDDVIAEEIDEHDTYDPRERAWYQSAVEFGDLYWSDVYVFYSDQHPGITVATPHFVNGTARGVFGVDIDVLDLSTFLANLQIAPQGQAILLDSDGNIVASPILDDLVVERETADGVSLELQHASESAMPAVAALIETVSMGDFVATGPESNNPLAGQVTTRFHSGGQNFIGVLQPILLEPNRELFIAITVPEDSLLAEINRTNTRNILISLVLVLLTLVTSFVIAKRLSRSLARLASASHRVRDLEFAQEATSSRFREVDEVLQAFEQMKTGLRGFQKYLPLELVRVLLKKRQEPQLGGELIEVTILFSDIAGFTNITERTPPMEMSTRLGTYMGALTDCIEATGGTVVQYVGDGVMAFWGAPLPVENHPVKACEAALACQEVIKDMWPEGDDFPPFETRIGIHTTTVAVGHFGTPDRLFYSAIGDGVNLTARLEGANKQYDTRIIVSETTHPHLFDVFETRHLDRVAVKGKKEPCDIFELIGTRGQVEQERIDNARCYEHAFEHYLARRFKEAIQELEDLLLQSRDDAAALRLRERCEAFIEKAPPDDWNGVFTMTSK